METEPTDADPARGLELLWRGPTTPRRGPKPRIDLARIVREAIQIADRQGLPAVSMRRIGNEVGVGTATLYTYVPGRAELLSLMLDTVAGYSTLPHDFPGDWRARFEAWALEDREILGRHPWAVELDSARVLPGPNAMAWYDSALSVLAATGLSEPEKVGAIEALDSYVRGSVSSAIARPALQEEGPRDTGPPGAGAAGESETGGEAGAGDVDSWLARRDATLVRLVDFERYPALLRTVVTGTKLQASENFEFGLVLVLDGIAALVDRRR